MEHWVSLETPAAYGLSVHEDGTLAAACADGLVRLFKADDLQYVATLPRPPPLGRANISSVRELQDIADLAAASALAAAAAKIAPGDDDDGGAVAPEENDDVNVGTVGDEASFGGVKGDQGRDGRGGGAGNGCATAIRYPAALGCRLSPSGTKVVCIYADRGLFIWDVTDPLCVGKYRSFLAHGGCIWDVQRMPGKKEGESAWFGVCSGIWCLFPVLRTGRGGRSGRPTASDSGFSLFLARVQQCIEG